MHRISELLPHWLAWPANLLSIAAAATGAGMVFYGAGFGDGSLYPFVWGAACFAGAGALWWIADLASLHRPY